MNNPFRHLRFDWELSLGFGNVKGSTKAGKAFIAICIAGLVVASALLSVSWIYSAIAFGLFFLSGFVILWVFGVHYNNISILVLLPDESRASEDEFYQDGVQQMKGFKDARAYLIARPLKVAYYPIGKEDNAQTLMSVIREKYRRDRATYFVMTMSSKIQSIRAEFSKWHQECLENGDRVPVLIATVTSAPNIAENEEDEKNKVKGIVRWYIRAKEESALLAEYMAWEKEVKRAVVFYVTHDSGRSTSPYGFHSFEIFKKRFERIVNGGIVDGKPVTTHDAEGEIGAWFGAQSAEDSSPMGIYVVGYGDVLKVSLNAILKQLPSLSRRIWIACTSTLTSVRDWQPTEKKYDDRIVTVKPRLYEHQRQLDTGDRSVVYLFSRETLRRVWRLASKYSESTDFLDAWKKGEDTQPENVHHQLDQEHLANGDVIVNVDIADHKYWRLSEAGATTQIAPQSQTVSTTLPSNVFRSRLMVYVFTDLAHSMKMKEGMGDDAFVEFVYKPHKSIFDESLARFSPASKPHDRGDGFLIIFESTAEAIRFALLFQYRLGTWKWEREPGHAHIGIHLGNSSEFHDATSELGMLAGQAVDLARRVTDLAIARQILLTRAVYDDGRLNVRRHPGADHSLGASTEDGALELKWLEHGPYLFTGKKEPVEICEVGATAFAPFQAPPESDKARRLKPS